MQVTERQEQGATVVDLEGRFDFGSRREFKESMERLGEVGGQHIILNLEKVSFVDSSALGLLVVAHQNLKLKQGRISMVNPQTYVRQILELANVPKMIPVYPSLQDALAGTSAPAAAVTS